MRFRFDTDGLASGKYFYSIRADGHEPVKGGFTVVK
jgi:hypothetical protein